MMTRKKAIEILKEHVKTDQIYRHCLAVEAAMRGYARKYGEDEDRWGNLGLLHDIDFEKHPDVHPAKVPEFLKPHGFDNEFIDSILSHGTNSPVPRDRKERQVLHAVDEMASFIIAVALMRPTGFEGLKAKSVKKKMKDKRFASAVNREELESSREALEVEFADHVDVIVKALVEQEEFLKKEGYSLLHR